MLRRALPVAAFVALVSASPLARADAKPILVDKIAAVVGEITILRSDVLAGARPLYAKIGKPEEHAAEIEQLHKDVLARMVEDVLVAREARRLNIQVVDVEIDQAKEWIAKQNKITRAQLEAEVKKQGVSKEEYDGELHRQLLAEKWVALVVRPRLKMAPPTSDKPEDQAPYIQALEGERKKAVAELHKTTFVEVRW
jgi:peptidyl-prolyl cis-trans isomerase SurA